MKKYLTLNLIEKVLSVLSIFLLIIFDSNFYLKVEYYISISAILISLFDFGILSYPFYLLRNTNTKITNNWIREAKFQFILISIIGFLFIIFNSLGFLVSRIISAIVLNIYKSETRINDKVFRYYLIAIPYYIIFCLTSILYYNDYIKFEKTIIFISILNLLLVSIFGEKPKISKNLVLIKSLKYAYPLIVQSFIFLGLTNAIKVYGYNNFDYDTQYSINIYMRFSQFIIIMGSAYLAYYKKHMFTELNISKKLLINFIILILISSFISLSAGYIFLNIKGFEINYSAMITIFYALPFSLLTYYEVLLARVNKNIVSMFSSFIALLIFSPVIWIDNISVELINTFVITSLLVSLIIRIRFLNHAR